MGRCAVRRGVPTALAAITSVAGLVLLFSHHQPLEACAAALVGVILTACVLVVEYDDPAGRP